MHLKISSEKWQPFCLGLNMLMNYMKYIKSSIAMDKYISNSIVITVPADGQCTCRQSDAKNLPLGVVTHPVQNI